MTHSDQREVRRFWNARAREDAFYFVDTRQRYGRPDEERFWDSAPLLELVLDGLGVTIEESDTVLEIGCGIGRITRALAARAAQVVALDVSDEMLERARRHNADLGHVQWLLGDGVSLAGVPSDSVDACVSLVVFQHVPDPAVTLGYVHELGRVLRPGGWAALQVSNDPEVHRSRGGVLDGMRGALGLGPRGRGHPAWLGSHIELSDLEAAARIAGLALEREWGAGTQYCQVLLRRGAQVGAGPLGPA